MVYNERINDSDKNFEIRFFDNSSAYCKTDVERRRQAQRTCSLHRAKFYTLLLNECNLLRSESYLRLRSSCGSTFSLAVRLLRVFQVASERQKF